MSPDPNSPEGADRVAAGPKIILIGLNKCGTTSFHRLFEGSGISSAHWHVRNQHLAVRIMNNIALGRPSLHGVEDYTAFSDMVFLDRQVCIEACRFFPTLHADYPDSYFVLNTRPVDEWIASRLDHASATTGEAFSGRALQAAGLSTLDELKDAWRHLFETHTREVRTFFSGNERFLEFDIQADNPAALRDHFSAHYDLDLSLWGKQNSRQERRAASKGQRAYRRYPTLSRLKRRLVGKSLIRWGSTGARKP